MRGWGLGLTIIALLGASATDASARAWRLQRPPKPPGEREGSLNSVACPTNSACTAVGDYINHAQADRNLAERWIGSHWSIKSTPNPRSDAGFNAISCPTATSCIAVGGVKSSWADRLASGRWHFQRLPKVHGPERWLRAVSCSSSNFCMAVGLSGPLTDSRPFAERWNGHRWSLQRVPLAANHSGGELKGVSCTGASACIAVGDDGGPAGSVVLAERWNGKRWQPIEAPNPNGDSIELNGVSCASSSWCEAVGDYANSGDGTFFGLVEHWDGKRWRIVHAAAPSGRSTRFELMAISCVGKGKCTAVGDSADQQLHGYALAERLANGRWMVQSTPQPKGLGAALDGVSCPKGGVCVAVGFQQTPDLFAPPHQLAERFS